MYALFVLQGVKQILANKIAETQTKANKGEHYGNFGRNSCKIKGI